MPRPLCERLEHELTSVRRELLESIEPLGDDDLDFAPSEGMKSYRALLREIGAMEIESAILLTENRIPTWEEAESHGSGTTVAEMLSSLSRIRERTLGFLQGKSEQELRTPRSVPESWAEYFGDSELEAEELIRWIVRHEYYHHGQIVSYRWIQGFNPYAS